MTKVFFKPTRYIWNFDKRVDKQEKKFFEEFSSNKQYYCEDINEDFVNYLDEVIIPRYKSKIDDIILNLRTEEDQNNLIRQLESQKTGMHLREAKEIIIQWNQKINEEIRSTNVYN